MSKLPRISETEWELMKILWKRSPLTAVEIIEHLTANDYTWHPKTARTLLSRLVKKRALGFRREGRGYLYRPLVRREDCLEAESESFLERVFGGSLHPMVAHFVERRKLSRDEINELKRLLDRSEEK